MTDIDTEADKALAAAKAPPMTPLEYVREFRRVTREKRGDKPDPLAPTIPDEDTRIVAARIMYEEVLETIHALGLYVGNGIVERGYNTPDLIEIADGVADVLYTAIGVAVACGINPEPILREVCENNALKLKNCVFINGKLQKPAGHPRPDIRKHLKAQAWERMKAIYDGASKEYSRINDDMESVTDNDLMLHPLPGTDTE